MSTITSRTVDPMVAVYDSPAPAEMAIKALCRAAFDMDKLSVVGERYRAEEHALGFYSTGDRITAGGGPGGFWDAVWRLMAGPAVSVVPQVGLVAAAGPFGLALIAARDRTLAAGVTGGISALAAALVSLGIGTDEALKYEADVKAHRVLFLVQGSPEDMARARSLLCGGTQQAPTASGRDAHWPGQGHAQAEGTAQAGSSTQQEWLARG
ncbi:MAG: DUF1269 domain-containing protein [Ramlibacter sp.]